MIIQMFFGLNLIFNGIMWALFTKALARGTSTTQVSILNTSSNFMITAILGWMIFSESLPPLWFAGAALLVAGNVIIGRRDEDEENRKGVEQERAENGEAGNEEAETLLVGEELDVLYESGLERKKREEEDVLQLDLEEENNGRSGGTLI
jgi:multidrug transporter EmrE-like cation transporter